MECLLPAKQGKDDLSKHSLPCEEGDDGSESESESDENENDETLLKGVEF